MFRNLFEKIMESIVYYPFYKWIYCNIYKPLFFNSRVIYRNAAYIVFDDDTFINDLSFQDKCDEKGLDWMEEIEKFYPKEILDEL